MLTAVIVDDEANSSNALKTKLLRQFPEVEVLGICRSGKEGIAFIESHQPAIVFLDIEMPRMNGFAMLQQLKYKNFELIFTTAYDHYAIQAIRFSALDYLVKPVEMEELRQAIERVKEKQQQQLPNKRLELLLENLQQKNHERHRIAVPSGNGLEFIKVDTIIYLEASINYTQLFLTGGRNFMVSRTMKDFEDILPADSFVRIHNSYIINTAFAERYIRGEGGQVVLSNGTTLEISKRKKHEFLKAFRE